MANKTWLVYKFGGTSMGSADRIASVAKIVAETHFSSVGQRKAPGKLATVVSAMSGVTNALIQLIDLAVARSPELPFKMEALKVKHIETAKALVSPTAAAAFETQITSDFRAIGDVLNAVSVMRECSDRIRDFVSGHGELWSATILAEHLKALGYACGFVDAREVLVVEPEIPSPTILWNESEKAFAPYANTQLDMLVVTGFICRTTNDVPCTLGRNGSDYSAAIFARLLDASECVIWTDVDGVLSADPRKVADAVIVPELSYREAIELAHFGAKVIHPMTMIPAVDKNIPIIIKNTFRPDFEGSRIQAESRRDKKFAIKGCTTVDNVACITIENASHQSLTAIAAKAYAALGDARIAVLLGTMGSPGNTVTVVVPAAQSAEAKRIIEKATVVERQNNEILPLEMKVDCAVLAVAGDGMIDNLGLAERFMGAMTKAGINIRAIAQGPAQRNISILISSADATRALRAAHAGFYLSPQTLSIGILGDNNVAHALLSQLNKIESRLENEVHCDLRVRGIVSDDKMLLAEKEIALSGWENEFATKATAADLTTFVEHINTTAIPHTLIIDCTQREETAKLYPQWIERGLHIISPNRNANAGDQSLYQKLQSEMRTHQRHYLYETMVCGALPIIETLADLIQTGDDIAQVEGVLSGILSSLFTALENGESFSTACRNLVERGTPRQELCEALMGKDTAQKALILARDLGFETSLASVSRESLLPQPLDSASDTEFWNAIASANASFAQRFAAAKKNNEILKYVGLVDCAQKSIFVGVRTYSSSHPFATLKAGDNAVAFYAKRYANSPLVVQGAGSAPESVASGLFADLLRLTRYLGSMG
jgi:aspartokinase/homoserine dehydrogenase 1